MVVMPLIEIIRVIVYFCLFWKQDPFVYPLLRKIPYQSLALCIFRPELQR
jgi:hypothetical protein